MAQIGTPASGPRQRPQPTRIAALEGRTLDPTLTPAKTVLLCKWQEELVRAFLAANVNLHLVLDDFDVTHNSPPAELLAAASCYRVPDFDSIESLATVAADLAMRGVCIDTIVSHTEFSQLGAAYLGLLLGDPSSLALQNLAARDKRLMKVLASKAGLLTARFRSLRSVDDVAGVDEITGGLTFPVVVKPAAGMGAQSTIRVDHPDKVRDALHEFRTPPYLKSPQLAVEEFISGRELHVDALWYDGKEVYFVISVYYETRLVLSRPEAHTAATRDGSYVVSPDDEPDLYERVRELQAKVNTAFGIANVPTHLEIFETPDGSLIFSEIATRIGGGYIPGLLSILLGSSVWNVIARVVTRDPAVAVRPHFKHLGGFIFKPLTPGTIKAMPTESDALSCPGVLRWEAIREIGDEVYEDPSSRWSALAVIGGETRAEYEEAVERAHLTLRIEAG
jgi:biotin carboxylase